MPLPLPLSTVLTSNQTLVHRRKDTLIRVLPPSFFSFPLNNPKIALPSNSFSNIFLSLSSLAEWKQYEGNLHFSLFLPVFISQIRVFIFVRFTVDRISAFYVVIILSYIVSMQREVLSFFPKIALNLKD